MNEVQAQLAVKAVYPNACSATRQVRHKRKTKLGNTLTEPRYENVWEILPGPTAARSVKPLGRAKNLAEAWIAAAKRLAKQRPESPPNVREPKLT